MSEFSKGMKELKLDLSDVDIQALFSLFDQDRNGSVSFDEFLYAIRGVLNSRRAALVNLAFDRLDKDGSGIVDFQDIKDVYNASRHPDVISGKRTEEAVLLEFLDTFEVGGTKDGHVTRDEFLNYYANISASIDDDDYFELMIRNAWHISGGEGWSANTANKRVLVTGGDGRQRVVEVADDQGLRQGDGEEAMRRLRSQGVDVTGVDMRGGVDEVMVGSRRAPPPRLAGATSTQSSAARRQGPVIATLSSLPGSRSSTGVPASQNNRGGGIVPKKLPSSHIN